MAEKKKFLLRIDEALWDDLQAWAADELRSVNGQIEYVLRQAVASRRRSSAPPAPRPPSDRSPPGA
jgi:hypothetical protein